MASRAHSQQTASTDNLPEDIGAPADLSAHVSMRSKEQHRARMRRHEDDPSNWLEAEQAIKADVERKGKTQV